MGYNFRTLTAASGDWTVPAGVTSIHVLVVAGGGGGGRDRGGGGGGGGVVYNATYSVTPEDDISYLIDEARVNLGGRYKRVSKSLNYTFKKQTKTLNVGAKKKDGGYMVSIVKKIKVKKINIMSKTT